VIATAGSALLIVTMAGTLSAAAANRELSAPRTAQSQHLISPAVVGGGTWSGTVSWTRTFTNQVLDDGPCPEQFTWSESGTTTISGLSFQPNSVVTPSQSSNDSLNVTEHDTCQPTLPETCIYSYSGGDTNWWTPDGDSSPSGSFDIFMGPDEAESSVPGSATCNGDGIDETWEPLYEVRFSLANGQVTASDITFSEGNGDGVGVPTLGDIQDLPPVTFTTALTMDASSSSVTQISPTSGPTTGGTAVAVTGTGFTGATGVTFGGVAGSGLQVHSDTSLTVLSPAQSAGIEDVVVTGPNGSSPAVLADRFTYAKVPVPISGTTPIVTADLTDSISDQVALTKPPGGPSPTGTVTFSLHGPSDPTCSSAAVFTAAVALSGSGLSAASGSFAPASAGNYLWVASYGGDANYSTSSTTCGAAGQTSTIVVPATFDPLTPGRICDTRTVSSFVPANQCNSGAVGNPIGPLTAGGTKTINVANNSNGGLGTFGVPADATSVVLNVTAVNPVAPGGFMTVWPAGASQPNASNLNYPAGETVPNLVQVGVGSGGDISFFSSDQTDLIVDVEGYSAAPAVSAGVLKGATVASTGALYNALSAPLRLCDTRAPSTFTPANQCDGPGSAAGTLAANMSRNVTVTNDTTIPSGATAAVLNVTVVNPAASGFLTAYPQGTSAPNASNLNFGAGQTTTNRVIVPLSAHGQISFVSSARTDVIVDVSGYFSAAGGTGAEFSPEGAPVRVCDTRAVSSFSPQNQCSGQHVGAGTSHEIPIKVTNGGSVSDGVPANAAAVVVNLTGIGPSASTFLTVFPGPTLPNSSDLNPAVGETRANLAVATVNANGTISVFNNTGSLDVIVDVLGWYS
jgi:hypothetical protein